MAKQNDAAYMAKSLETFRMGIDDLVEALKNQTLNSPNSGPSLRSVPYEENETGRMTLRVVKGDAQFEFRCHGASVVEGGAIAVTIRKEESPVYVSAAAWDFMDICPTANLPGTGTEDEDAA